jgi:hypothetical protein
MRQYAGHDGLREKHLAWLAARVPEPAAAPWLNASIDLTDKRAIGDSLMALFIFTQ